MPEEQEPSTGAVATETGDQAGAPPDDPLRRSVLETLQARLGDRVLAHGLARGELCVRVDRSAWQEAGRVCRDELGMTYFCFLSGIDWLPNPDLVGEKAWESEQSEAASDAAPSTMPTQDAGGPLETGVAGGESRFQVFARLYNVDTKVGVTLKADVDEEDPRIDSWVPLWRGADWHERECWEMYGFQFDGHPAMRHLYLPQEFEGHPLRKDFPLLARLVKPWPGLVDVEAMPGEPAGGEEANEEA